MRFTHHTTDAEEPKPKHVFFGKKAEERENKPQTETRADNSPNQRKSMYGSTSNYAIDVSNRRMNGGKIPKGWAELPEHGHVISGTKFIAIKCPLSPYLFSTPNNFHLESFINNEKEQGREIGLIVDLTNTNRYYDPKLDIPEGIAHIKISTKGHDEAPDRLDVEFFDRKVNDFMKQHPTKYIIVHCTHGLNRTGFMITNWMCNHLSLNVDDALNAFNMARPPGMYSPILLDALYERNNCTHSARYQAMDYGSIPFWSKKKLEKLIVKKRLVEKRNLPNVEPIKRKAEEKLEEERPYKRSRYSSEYHEDRRPERERHYEERPRYNEQRYEQRWDKREEKRKPRAPRKNKDKYDPEKRKLMKENKRYFH